MDYLCSQLEIPSTKAGNNSCYIEADMVKDASNLNTDVVKNMLAESLAKEPRAVVADRIPELLKSP